MSFVDAIRSLFQRTEAAASRKSVDADSSTIPISLAPAPTPQQIAKPAKSPRLRRRDPLAYQPEKPQLPRSSHNTPLPKQVLQCAELVAAANREIAEMTHNSFEIESDNFEIASKEECKRLTETARARQKVATWSHYHDIATTVVTATTLFAGVHAVTAGVGATLLVSSLTDIANESMRAGNYWEKLASYITADEAKQKTMAISAYSSIKAYTLILGFAGLYPTAQLTTGQFWINSIEEVGKWGATLAKGFTGYEELSAQADLSTHQASLVEAEGFKTHHSDEMAIVIKNLGSITSTEAHNYDTAAAAMAAYAQALRIIANAAA